MKEVIVFGTGIIAKRIEIHLKELNYEVKYYIDNDAMKVMFNGKRVIRPTECQDANIEIIIASIQYEEIVLQLKEMKKLNNVIYYLELLERIFERKCVEMNWLKSVQSKNDSTVKLVTDYNFYIPWGGGETGNRYIAQGLKKYTQIKPVVITGDLSTIGMTDDDFSVYLCKNKESSWETVCELAEFFVKYRPCVLLNICTDSVYYAARIAQYYYPEQVKIITLQNTSNVNAFYVQGIFEATDKVLTISDRLYNHLVNKFNFKHSIIEKQLNFIVQRPEHASVRSVMAEEHTVKLAMGLRLERASKRADYIITLIEELEKLNFPYEFNIAGDGTYYEIIFNYIRNKKLTNKVKLKGKLKLEQMSDFWLENDIYLSVSDDEGMSRSMIDAMSFGLVPIVTDVSGVRDVICNDYNGKIVPIGAMKEMAQIIQYFQENKQIIRSYGNRSKKIVEERCNYKEYILHLERITKEILRVN